MSVKDKIIDVWMNPRLKIQGWFEKPQKDEDFESGIAVGTEVYNGKCVFLDKNGLCTLQKMADVEGEHKWKYKPIYCILFPLVVWEETFTIDDDHINRLIIVINNPSLWRQFMIMP